MHQAQESPGTVFPYTAQTSIAIFNKAEMIAEPALYLMVVQFLIQESLFHGFLLTTIVTPP